MKDTSRNEIRKVLAPSMYGMMLSTNNGIVACAGCVEHNIKEIVRDIRNGHTQSYKAVSLIEVETGLYCDYCGEFCSEYILEGEEYISEE